MKNIDPTFLRTYLAVAKTGSFAAAAKVVGRTVATISYQMAKLESVVGHKLFLRAGRSLVLSEIGRQFVEEARSVIQVHDQVLDKKWSPISPIAGLASARKKSCLGNSSDTKIKTFEDNLETKLLNTAFSIWKSFRADQKELSLDDFVGRGIISLQNDNILLSDCESSIFRIIGASAEPTRLFQFDKHGFGMTAEQMWKSPKICESRKRIFSICRDADVPVFFSGNAAIPWHLDMYSNTIEKFSVTRLDRLLLPIKLKSQTGNGFGILQIAQLRGRIELPFQKRSELSEQEYAESLNFVGNVSVAG